MVFWLFGFFDDFFKTDDSKTNKTATVGKMKRKFSDRKPYYLKKTISATTNDWAKNSQENNVPQVEVKDKEKMRHEINQHNQRCMRRRSNSLSRGRKGRRVYKGKGLSYRGNEDSLTLQGAYGRQKDAPAKPPIPTGLKLVPKRIIRSFAGGTENDPEPREFKCTCNEDSVYKKLRWNSQHMCKRMTAILKNKYDLETGHSKLKAEFEELRASEEVSETLKDQIRKDVRRTYSENLYLKSEASRADIQTLLEGLALKYPEIGYVQGMNFIVATCYFHADLYFSYGAVLYLFESLEMKDIFLPSKFLSFLAVF